MLVLMRDQQAVEALLGHLGAEQRQVFGPEGRIGGFVECLAHEGLLLLLPLWEKVARQGRMRGVGARFDKRPSARFLAPLVRPASPSTFSHKRRRVGGANAFGCLSIFSHKGRRIRPPHSAQ